MRWACCPHDHGVAMKTLYDVLGVRADADAETVKRAFRKAVKAHHPDLRDGDAERIRAVIAANAVLRDPDQRAAYDQHLAIERELSQELSWAWRYAALRMAFAIVVLSTAMISASEWWLNWTPASSVALRRTAQRIDLAEAARPEQDRIGIAAPEPAVDFSIIDALPPAAPLPTTASSYRERAFDWSKRGDLDRAIADLDQAIQLAPDDVRAYRDRGNAWGRKGDTDRALADYEQAIRLHPDDPGLLHDRALMWQRKGELDKALVDLDRSVRISFADPEAYSDRGAVWFIKGNYDRALADFNQAIKINPRLATAYVRRAEVLERKGDQERARADRDQASHLDDGAVDVGATLVRDR